MSGEHSITSLLIPQSPREATECVRRTLAAAGLRITAEIDFSTRLSRGFRIDFPFCRVLCVDYPPALLEALTFDRSAAVLMPVHLVITEQAESTVIQLLTPSATVYGALPTVAQAAVSKIFAAVHKALQTVSAHRRCVETTA